MTYGTPIQFVDRESGDTLNGRLMPEDEASLEKIVAAMRVQLAALAEGSSFVVRVSRPGRGKVKGHIDPPRIEIGP